MQVIWIRGNFSRCARCVAYSLCKFIPNMCLWSHDWTLMASCYLHVT